MEITYKMHSFPLTLNEKNPTSSLNGRFDEFFAIVDKIYMILIQVAYFVLLALLNENIVILVLSTKIFQSLFFLA